MTQTSDEGLDLERAEYEGGEPAALACRSCQKVLESYHSLNGQPICEACLATARKVGEGSLLKALGLGLMAGAVGALGYYVIRELTGYDLALVTIVVGIMVGIAVRKGAGFRNNAFYRVLAVGLTYVAMCSTYVPMVAQGIVGDGSGDAAESAAKDDAEDARAPRPAPNQALVIVVASAISLAVPFFLIKEVEVLALLIFGFGLWEAWRLSAPAPFVVEGPFEARALAPAEPSGP
jgi:hypothetical protein